MGESEIDCLAEEMWSIWDVVAEWIRSRNVSGLGGTQIWFGLVYDQIPK